MQYRALMVLLAALVLSGGCDVDELTDEAEDAALADAEEVGVVREYDGWSLEVSEEQMPVNCYGGSAVNGVQCRGSYCDNTRILCKPTGLGVGGTAWTSYFSEEQPEQFCPAGHWMTGLGCKGRYCDNISLQCTHYPNANENDCHWTGWVSEEGGGLLTFGAGYFARGAQCRGRYCDNKRFYVCKT